MKALHGGKVYRLDDKFDTVDESCKGKVVKHFVAHPPDCRRAILPLHFFIEAVAGGYLSDSEEHYLDSWLPLRRVTCEGCMTL